MGVSAHAFPGIVLPAGPAGTRAGHSNRTFHAYLELTMQSKHDAVIRGHCRTVGCEARRADGTSVLYGADRTGAWVLANFYPAKARLACEIVRDQMNTLWAAQGVGAAPVFVRLAPGAMGSQAAKRNAAVQRVNQRDGYRYEISYWYDVQDIYVLFHCYPG